MQVVTNTPRHFRSHLRKGLPATGTLLIVPPHVHGKQGFRYGIAVTETQEVHVLPKGLPTLAAAKADTKRRFGLKKVEVFEPKPPAPPKPVFETGQEVRIMTEDYGKSYKGRKGTVADVTEDVIMVTVPRRKTPMSINPNHLESV